MVNKRFHNLETEIKKRIEKIEKEQALVTEKLEVFT